jgi:hypothetical protein
MTEDQLRATERWFYRRGLPFLVEDYRSSTDVWTRATPFLAVAFLLLVLASSINGADPGWALAGLGSAAVVLAVYAIRNTRRGRRWNALPRRVGWPFLAAFVAVPTLVAAVSEGEWPAILQAAALSAAVLLVTWVVTRYAVIPLLTWAVRYTFRGIGDLYRLATRALPLMLLFITFLFINTEVWQVAGPLVGVRLWVVISLFALLGIGFILGRVPSETRRIESTTSAETVVEACQGTPLADVAPTVQGIGTPVPLTRRQWANVGLVMTVAQLVQVTLFAGVVWAFFVVFGAIAIPVELQALWLEGLSTIDVVWPLGDGHGVTRELLRTATFLGAFAGFYVTIYTATDSVYREQFYDRIRTDVERSLYVRRVYVAMRAGSPASPAGDPAPASPGPTA